MITFFFWIMFFICFQITVHSLNKYLLTVTWENCEKLWNEEETIVECPSRACLWFSLLFIDFELVYNNVNYRKLITKQKILGHTNANELCSVECNWLLPGGQINFASIWKFISAFLTAYTYLALGILFWNSCSIFLVLLLINELNKISGPLSFYIFLWVMILPSINLSFNNLDSIFSTIIFIRPRRVPARTVGTQ